MNVNLHGKTTGDRKSGARGLRLLGVGALAVVLGGCGDEGIRAYRAPKPPPKAVSPPAAAQAQVAWTAPAGWEPVESSEPLRLATFRPPGGAPEIAVTAFPGESGGLLANINRWRGQIGLPPIGEADLGPAVSSTTVEGVVVTTAEMAGTDGRGMLGAVIVPGDGQTWFVKAAGDPAALARLKPAFEAFARSFRLVGQRTPVASTDQAEARLMAWDPPAHWRADQGASAVVAAAFDAANDAGGCRITATVLLNDGGGTLSNINRWREQMGLAAVARLDQQPATDLGNGNLMVDLASADGTRRMMAAILLLQGRSWFFKITGSVPGVEAERAQFERFVRVVGLGETP